MADWDKIESSGQVEDRRGNQVGTSLVSLGATLVIGFLMFAGGASPAQIQNVLSQISTDMQNTTQGEFVDTKQYKEFAQKVIGSNNEIWQKEITKYNIKYQEPKLVLFRGNTQSGCGIASTQIGPHYCPRDQTIYLDETFFEELTKRFGAKGGDVAESYVMAHEVGHHIQNLQGKFRTNNNSDNQTSIKLELQADCYAGVWAGNIKSQGIISDTEIDQAIDAAEAVGDDRIQKTTGNGVNPETWTHGSSKERKQWFLVGYNSQDSKQCNTI
jgi:uncharacterized protein